MCKPHSYVSGALSGDYVYFVCVQTGGNYTVYVAGEFVDGASKFGSVFCIGAMTSSVYPGDGVSVTVSACLCFPSTRTSQRNTPVNIPTCSRAELLRTYVRISQSNNLPNRNTNSNRCKFSIECYFNTVFSPKKPRIVWWYCDDECVRFSLIFSR